MSGFKNDWSLPTFLKLLQLYIIDHLQNSTPLRYRLPVFGGHVGSGKSECPADIRTLTTITCHTFTTASTSTTVLVLPPAHDEFP